MNHISKKEVLLLGLLCLSLTTTVAAAQQTKAAQTAAKATQVAKAQNAQQPQVAMKDKAKGAVATAKDAQADQKPMHEDMTPKNGGQMYLSSNNYNHLEGVLNNPTEFRVYVYDGYNSPVDASTSKGSVKLKVKKWFREREVVVPLESKEGQTYLTAALPKKLKFPVKVQAMVTFPMSTAEENYTFEFKEVSKPAAN